MIVKCFASGEMTKTEDKKFLIFASVIEAMKGN
jgi:hypothetical protein